ncbi:sigma-70 family RNA polymerase sigma factor [Maribellus comscasis]|uniref:Sigma-70 family RNA polymerase sigma factor n=1 Tax=Maribellus comscasis TaxID=2681766 RepID=A0A6I6JPS0_9BACT|nr:RNA polymerase sigma factor [Maribellus comscasis]QGY43010.1 sigma-70 family RNA polymerase sigma factor [Maribellus comscasis]
MESKHDIYYIEKVKNGQTQYYSYIVEKYKDIVFSIALKVLKNREDAEEMAQESFIKAFKSLHTFKGKAKFSTWLYRITYNNCISEVRKRKIHFASTDDIEIKDDDSDFNLDGLPEENREKYIKAALEKLPEDEYTLVLLYYFEDQSIEEISKVTRISESNAKVKLFRARKKLYTILNDMLKEEIYTIL